MCMRICEGVSAELVVGGGGGGEGVYILSQELLRTSAT